MAKYNRLYIEEAQIPILRNRDNPRQYEFLTTRTPFVLFSGGVGAGKTAAFCFRCIALSVDSPYFGDMSGNVGLVGRFSLKSFYKTTYPELMKWIPRSWVRRYWKNDDMLELKNESVIHFTHFDTMEHLHSYNLGWAGVDQMEQIPEAVFWGVGIERIRLKYFNRYEYVGRTAQQIPVQPPVKIPIHTVFGTANPKQNWIKRVFWQNEQYRESPDPDTQKRYNPSFQFITVSTEANEKFLPEQYLRHQRENMSKREYDRRVLGLMNAFEGQIYEDFSDEFQLPERRIPKPSWPIYVGIDHGGTGSAPASNAINITAAVFMALEERTGDYPKLHVFDELYLPSSTIEETVEAIDHKLRSLVTLQRLHYRDDIPYEFVGNHPPNITWRCDPSMNRRSGDTVETIMEAYMRHAQERGFIMALAPGDNELISGIHKVSWLFRKKLVDINPHCVHFIEEHHSYEYGDNEKPKRGQADHLVDSFRYCCSALLLWWKDFRIEPKKTIFDKEMERMAKAGLVRAEGVNDGGRRNHTYFGNLNNFV